MPRIHWRLNYNQSLALHVQLAQSTTFTNQTYSFAQPMSIFEHAIPRRARSRDPTRPRFQVRVFQRDNVLQSRTAYKIGRQCSVSVNESFPAISCRILTESEMPKKCTFVVMSGSRFFRQAEQAVPISCVTKKRQSVPVGRCNTDGKQRKRVRIP